MARWLLILGLCLAGCAISDPRPAALFDQRRWQGPIWIPAEADFEEYAAARALAEACEQVTGVRPDVREEDGAAATGIFVGRTQAAVRAGVVAPAGDGDTAARRTVGGALLLVGNSPVATRIAVGRLCEQSLGITFVMPGLDGMDFAPLTRVEWPEDETWHPAFAWRSVSGFEDAESIEWGRRVGFGNRPECTHGLHAVFTPELYAQRPELFASAQGKRLAPGQGARSAQPNLAHPDAAGLAAAHLRRTLERNPRLFAVPLGINDSVVYDDGPGAAGASRIFDGRPDRSDYVFGFLNRVAAADWNPGGDHAIGCLAYLDTQRAPSFPVAAAVFPAICADRIQYANPAFAQADAANLAAWGRSGARRIGTWDYLFGRDVVIPRWHLGAQAESIRAARAAGVCSWFAELDPLWAYDAPKAWVAAKLLDNPQAGATALAERWARAAYGPAAPPMLALQRRIERAWAEIAARRKPGQWLVGWRDGCSAAELVTPDLESAVAEALKAARTALGSAPRDARHDRMRARLEQFGFAWQLSVAEARRCRLANAAGAGPTDAARPAGELWVEMLAAEAARDRAEAELNRHLWAGSQQVKWSASTQANPWPLLAGRMSQAELASAPLPPEAPAAARVALSLARDRADPSRLTVSSGQLDSDREVWRRWLAPPGALASGAGGVEARAPQGRFSRSVPVEPGDRLRVTIEADAPASFAEGFATVTVRFPGRPKVVAPKPLHAPPAPPTSQALPYAVRIWGRTVLEVPVGDNPGGSAEVEIAFVDQLPRTRTVTIERIAPRR